MTLKRSRITYKASFLKTLHDTYKVIVQAISFIKLVYKKIVFV
jgi:hypothetical protein